MEKDAPVSRAVNRAGRIFCRPNLGGLHHQYARIEFTTGTAQNGFVTQLPRDLVYASDGIVAYMALEDAERSWRTR